jgi:hypothetical protein
MTHGIRLLAFVTFAALCGGAAGCAESNFIIPLRAGDAPSKFWTDDPGTRGWNGVVVEYAIFGDGHVDALVRSRDGRHRFKARGRHWYENPNGERSDAYLSDDQMWVVQFDGREERYFGGDTTSMRGRALILTKAGATTKPIPPGSVQYVQDPP